MMPQKEEGVVRKSQYDALCISTYFDEIRRISSFSRQTLRVFRNPKGLRIKLVFWGASFQMGMPVEKLGELLHHRASIDGNRIIEEKVLHLTVDML